MNRNDRCSCGSGLKFKHCCLNKEELSQKLEIKKRKEEAEIIKNLEIKKLNDEALEKLKKETFIKHMTVDGYYEKQQIIRKRWSEYMSIEANIKSKTNDELAEAHRLLVKEIGFGEYQEVDFEGKKEFTFDEVTEDKNICYHDDGYIATNKDYYYTFTETVGDYITWGIIDAVLTEKGIYESR